MRALVQRVRSATVSVDGGTIGRIHAGLVVFLGVRSGDDNAAAAWLADKCVHLRVFRDADGKFNLSAVTEHAEILVVSQFTLYGDCRKGRRPSFTEAAPPEISEPLYEEFVRCVRASGVRVATGRFGADMLVSIENDGPVTVMIESPHA